MSVEEALKNIRDFLLSEYKQGGIGFATPEYIKFIKSVDTMVAVSDLTAKEKPIALEIWAVTQAIVRDSEKVYNAE